MMDRKAKFKASLHEHYEQAKALKRKFWNRMLLLFISLFLFVEVILLLHREGIITLPDVALRGWPVVVFMSVAFLVASVLTRIINALIFKTFREDVEVEKRLFLSKLYAFIIYLIAIIISLNAIGVTAQNITIFAGFIATGFALSMREVILSYVVWMVLLFKKPFRIGDIIKFGDDEGLVEHIGTFYVKLSDGSGDPERSVRIPTKLFLDKTIQNYGTADFLEVIRLAVPETVDHDKAMKKATAAVNSIVGKDRVMVNYETDALGAVKIIVVYPVVFEQRRNTRTRIIAAVHKVI